MTYVKRGEIYWVNQNPYRPTYGSVQTPGRPGIVVSNDSNNRCSSTAEIVYLTKAPKAPLPTHCTIKATGVESTVLCEQVQTISINDQIGDYLGTCTEAEMADVERCIAISLGLTIENNSQEPATDDSVTDKSVIESLQRELEKARYGEQLLRELYAELLEKTMA